MKAHAKAAAIPPTWTQQRIERTCPRLAALGLIDGVQHIERIRVRLPQRVELLAEEDVGLGLVREDELELGLVGRVGERVGEDLVERGAAGS